MITFDCNTDPNIKCLDGISASDAGISSTIDELDQLMMHEYSSMLLANTSYGYVNSNCCIGQSKCDLNCTSDNLLDAENDGSIPLNDVMYAPVLKFPLHFCISEAT